MSDQLKIIDLLFHVMRELRRGFDLSAAEYGLTMSRARVLSTLATMEGATQAELAAALSIEAPTLKRQIDALTREGFIERQAIEGDARKRALHLTDKARSGAITSFVKAIRTELLTGVDDRQLDGFQKILEQIATNAESMTRR